MGQSHGLGQDGAESTRPHALSTVRLAAKPTATVRRKTTRALLTEPSVLVDRQESNESRRRLSSNLCLSGCA